MTGDPYMPTVSASDDQETPPYIFDPLMEEFQFTMDPACKVSDYSAKQILENDGVICIHPDDELTDTEYQEQIYRDGLEHPWSGRVWLNPPWGRKLRLWVPKAYNEVASGNAELVVALLPARMDTKWSQEYVIKSVGKEIHKHERIASIDGHPPTITPVTRYHADMAATEIRWRAGRITFTGYDSGVTIGAMIVVWRREE